VKASNQGDNVCSKKMVQFYKTKTEEKRAEQNEK
jgi:hypothetical protein